jgi:hypothetical protein
MMQQTQLGNQAYAIPQMALSNLASYMGLGQQASNYAGQLGALAAQQMGTNMAGLGMLASPASNLLFGQQGLSGALGLGSGGLLGGLGGAGAGANLAMGALPSGLSYVGASGLPMTAGDIAATAAYPADVAAATTAAGGGGGAGLLGMLGLK